MKMKKLGILVASVLLAGMAFTSCASDDDSNNVGSVVGKWNFSTQKITSNGVVINEGPYNGNEQGCATDYIELFDDNTVATGDYNENCELDVTTSTYTRTGNVLNVTDGEIAATFEIVTANATTLLLKNTYEYEGVAFTTEVKYSKAQ